MPHTLHLIANAHLDPVWLWDRHEGLNQGIATCRTMLDLLDEDPDFKFIRGEAAIYEHIERFDPKAFARIAAYVDSGRWEIVGGTYIQPDTNLPATETMARHFLRGQRYFESRFGKAPRIAWAADSFGHSAGLPEVLAAAGVEGYAFSRPSHGQLPLDSTAFWWEAASGAKVLGYRVPVGWYGTERDEVLGRLDGTLAAAAEGKLENIGVFYGVGNHGGGPTRRQLADIRAWTAAHPEVTVLHSGLHRLFDALRGEAERGGDGFLPTLRGELNFCLRGCYVSAARVKYPYRRLEAGLLRAERTDAVIGAALGIPTADLSEPWDAVLLNSFHDILTGTCSERAMDDQVAQIGGAVFAAQTVEAAALIRLADQIDTQVALPAEDHPSAVPFIVWNPYPTEYRGTVELETCLDFRPLFDYSGRPDEVPLEVTGGLDRSLLPFQRIAHESDFFTHAAIRTRGLVPVTLPPLGWSVVTLGYVEGARPAPALTEPVATAPTPGTLDNGIYSVTASIGESGIQIFRSGSSLFGEDGLTAVTFEDTWGPWGGLVEETDSLDISTVREVWKITAVKTMEDGPVRASLWVRLEAGSSRLDFTISLSRGRDAVDVFARVFWNERAARLKLVMPAGDRAEFEIPGGSIERGPEREVPGGRWVRILGPVQTVGFASDTLYGFDCKDGALRASVVRSSRYASDRPLGPAEDPERPPIDCGEMKFRFLLTGDSANLPQLSRVLESPVVALQVPVGPGPMPRVGSLAALTPATLQLLALKPAEDRTGWIVRVQEITGVACEAALTWLGEPLTLGSVEPHEIASWKIGAGGVTRIGISESTHIL